MMATVVSKTEFRRHIKKYMRLAEKDIVIITVSRMPQFVLMKAEYYDALRGIK